MRTADGSVKSTGSVPTSNNNSTTSIALAKGEYVQFKGDNATYYNGGASRISCSKNCYVYGNIMSLVTSTGYATETELTGEKAFQELFSYNSYRQPLKTVV